MGKNFAGYLIGALILVLAAYFIITYNGLVKKDENVNLKWNEVQNVYQRRLDLVPNLVATVKGGADFEQNTLTKVADARGKMISGVKITADAANTQLNAQDELATAVNRLLINVENYPELKGAKAFGDLQVQLEGTERRIKIARKDFNQSIQDYNSAVRSFPTKLVAGILGFSTKEGFKSVADADKAVEIKF